MYFICYYSLDLPLTHSFALYLILCSPNSKLLVLRTLVLYMYVYLHSTLYTGLDLRYWNFSFPLQADLSGSLVHSEHFLLFTESLHSSSGAVKYTSAPAAYQQLDSPSSPPYFLCCFVAIRTPHWAWLLSVLILIKRCAIKLEIKMKPNNNYGKLFIFVSLHNHRFTLSQIIVLEYLIR